MTSIHWLGFTAALTALLWVPYVLDRILKLGLVGAMANPEPEWAAKQAVWAIRAKAAHSNAVENLAVFGVLVLCAAALGKGGEGVVLAATQIYFWSRLLHFAIYSAGLPVLRTVLFLAGVGCQIAVAVTLIP